MNKKVALIQPTFRKMDGKPVKGFTLGSCPLELPLLAALIPPDWQKTSTHEYFDDIDYSTDASVVFLVSTTNDILHARNIAYEFRKRGKKVFFGGHEDQFSETILEGACDSFYRGIPDATDMKQMLSDAESGNVKQAYQFGHHLDYPYDYSVYSGKRVRFIHVQASAGCKFKCEYCRHPYSSNGGSAKLRNIDCVIEDLRSIRKITKYAAFKDPNFYNSREHLIKLCSRIIEEKIGITWGAQMPIYAGNDPEALELMYKAGCRVIYIGLETLDQKNLEGVKKPFHADQYLPLIDKIQKAGIRAVGYFILGFDNDNHETFDTLFKFVRESRIAYPLLNILVPIPGTPLFERMKREGRLDMPDEKTFAEKNPLYSIPCNRAYYEPKLLTRRELEDGYMHLVKRLASLREVLRRSFYKLDRYTLFVLKMNLSFRKDYLRMASTYQERKRIGEMIATNQMLASDLSEQITAPLLT